MLLVLTAFIPLRPWRDALNQIIVRKMVMTGEVLLVIISSDTDQEYSQGTASQAELIIS